MSRYQKRTIWVEIDNEESPTDCANSQPSLFNHSVSDHTVAEIPLCRNSRLIARRNPMLLGEHSVQNNNWHYYNQAQENEKHRFQELLFDLCTNVNDIPRLPGAGRSRLPMSDMLYAVVYKVYECVSGRRFMSDLKDAQSKGFISRVPHFNSIFNYLETDEMYSCLKELIRLSSMPLKDFEINFAVDSSGFSTGQFTRWMTYKYGKPQYDSRIKWLKCHLMCGVSTNIVTSVEITDRFQGDHGQFAPLVEETSRYFELHHVTADKAYLSEKNLRLVHDKGGMAFIPFKPNNKLGDSKRDPVWKNMYHYFHLHQEKFLQYYHRRSNVETTFSMIKRKFGERLRSKGETAQINEVLCKVLCHNICCVIHAMYELGIDPQFVSKKVA